MCPVCKGGSSAAALRERRRAQRNSAGATSKGVPWVCSVHAHGATLLPVLGTTPSNMLGVQQANVAESSWDESSGFLIIIHGLLGWDSVGYHVQGCMLYLNAYPHSGTN